MAKSSSPAIVQSSDGFSRTAGIAAAVIFTLAIVALVYGPALSARALSIDDQQYLIENPLVRTPSWNSITRFFGEVLSPSSVEGYYHPLAMTSLMLDVAMGGSTQNLTPFRRTNLLLHLANCAMLILVLRRLFFPREMRASGRSGGPGAQPPVTQYATTLAATLTVLMLAVHPLAVEPVVWLAERKTLLAGVFSLLSLLAYLRFVDSRRTSGLILSLVCYLAALLSKPTSLSLPIVMLLIDWWPLKRLSAKAVLEKTAFLILALGMATITYISQSNTASTVVPGANSILRIPLIITHNIGFYLTQFLWPAHVSGHYVFPAALSLSEPAFLRGVILSVVVLVILAFSLRSTRSFVAGFLIWFVMLLPTLQLVGFTDVIAADKYLYLPSIGVAIVLCHGLNWLLSQGFNQRRNLIVLAAAVLLVGEIVSARRALAKWSYTEALYKHMLVISPNDARVHSYLALHYSEHNRPVDAFRHCEAAMREPLRDDQYPVNIGTTLARIGRSEAAVVYYQDVLKQFPGSASIHANLAALLSEAGDIEKAIQHGRRAIELKPTQIEAHNNLGNSFLNAGMLEDAVKSYEVALALRPDVADIHNNYGVALFQLDRDDEALREFETATRLRSDYPDPYRNKALVLASQGRLAEAKIACTMALSLEPKNPLNHALMGDLLMHSNRPGDARGAYLNALNLSPGLPGAERGLAGAEAAIAAMAASQPSQTP